MKRSFCKVCLWACITLFSVSCSNGIYCQIVKFHLFPPSVVETGKEMVDANFVDVNGQKKRLSDYSEEGKYLLLNFWDAGCGYVKGSLPEMKEVSENYNKNISLIGINLDDKTNWKAGLSMYEMPWQHIRDPKRLCGVASKYGIEGIPYYVIISPEGKVVDRWFGYREGIIKEKVSENVK